MGSRANDSIPVEARDSRYPRRRMVPVQHLLSGALGAILRKAPLSPEKVAFAWRTAVGPAVDRVTSIELRGSILYVRAADAAWQRELERSAAVVRARLETLLGPDVVRFVEVTVDSPEPRTRLAPAPASGRLAGGSGTGRPPR